MVCNVEGTDQLGPKLGQSDQSQAARSGASAQIDIFQQDSAVTPIRHQKEAVKIADSCGDQENLYVQNVQCGFIEIHQNPRGGGTPIAAQKTGIEGPTAPHRQQEKHGLNQNEVQTPQQHLLPQEVQHLFPSLQTAEVQAGTDQDHIGNHPEGRPAGTHYPQFRTIPTARLPPTTTSPSRKGTQDQTLPQCAPPQSDPGELCGRVLARICSPLQRTATHTPAARATGTDHMRVEDKASLSIVYAIIGLPHELAKIGD